MAFYRQGVSTLKKNSKLNMWNTVGFMIRCAWGTHKSVIFLSIAMAAATAGKVIVEMLIAPMVLHQVEIYAPLQNLLYMILVFSGLLLLLAGLKAYLKENTLFGRIAVRTDIMIRLDLKAAKTSYSNLLDTKFTDMESKAFRSTSTNKEASEAIWNTCTEILTNIIGFIAYLILIADLNSWIIVLVLFTTLISYYTGKRIHEWGYHHREEEAAYKKRLWYMQETMIKRKYAKDIRIFGMKPWLEDVWNSSMNMYHTFLTKREKKYLWVNVIDVIMTILRNGIAYIYLIWLVLAKDLSASSFLLYFSALSGFTSWVTGILNNFTTLHKQCIDISAIQEFLEWNEPFAFEEGEPLPKEDKAYEIQLVNVSYRYPNAAQDTIHNMNLTLRPDENVAIVGLNGAGKTTLVKLICGFIDPTEGQVLLNHQDIRKYNRRDYYALISAVFQDFSVLEATVAFNVAQSADDVDEKLVWQCLEKAGLSEKVKTLPKGLETNLGKEVFKDGIELSGGQTQRLMLARALYKDAPILILDEPTAALDPIAENDIYRKYNEMTKGSASLFISHRLASTRFCDRILFLEKGNIMEEGTHEELLNKNGRYAKLFHIQSQYYQEGAKFYGNEEIFNMASME